MEQSWYNYCVIFVVLHILSFSVVTIVQFYRARHLHEEYHVESSRLNFLQQRCTFKSSQKLDKEKLTSEIKDVLKELRTRFDKHKHKVKRQATLESLVADLFKAQEAILEQHCINNTRLCVHGSKGLPGLKGDKGILGVKGAKGEMGRIGDPGLPGAKGEPGLKGDTGSRGDVGDPGPRGPPGVPGPKGATGDPGSAGLKGEMGEQGLPGDIGERGLPGDKGAKGVEGSEGVKGVKGFAGQKGMPGQKGEMGDEGTPGKILDTNCLCKAPEPKKRLQVGDKVTLTCPEPQATQITWYKDTHATPSRMSQSNQSLVIDDLYPGDGGIYKCSAHLKGQFTRKEHLFKITVHGQTGYDCDFETNLCSWTQSTSDDTDWIRHNGTTSSLGTGPQADHTNNRGTLGHYIYIEASSVAPNAAADLTSADFPANQNFCFTMWYNMYGKETKDLSVSTDAKGTRIMVWHKENDQGQNWHRAVADLPSSGQEFKVIIQARRGISYHGDIAIDDIIVYTGSCSSHNLTPA